MTAPSDRTEQTFIDISQPRYGVQVTVREDGQVMWVSVDGLTVCRINRINYLELNLPGLEMITYGETDEAEEE